jgi:hypothetical protein
MCDHSSFVFPPREENFGSVSVCRKIVVEARTGGNERRTVIVNPVNRKWNGFYRFAFDDSRFTISRCRLFTLFGRAPRSRYTGTEEKERHEVGENF